MSPDAQLQARLRVFELWAEAYRERSGVPGFAVGVVHGQDLLWARGFGFSDRERRIPATPQTLYRVGSLTKWVTATAVMQLRDQGKLQLHQPILEYLPWVRMQGMDPEGPAMTAYHLLTHSSGMPMDAAFRYWADFRYPTREELIESVQKQRVIFPAGARQKYSNLAFAVAGELVHEVSTQSYASYVEEHLLNPLGMRRTSMELPEPARSELAVGYSRPLADGSRVVRPYSDLKSLGPAGGMTSSIEELAKFAALQFQEGEAATGPVIAPLTLKEMHRAHWVGDWKMGTGLGCMSGRAGDRRFVSMGGDLPGYTAQLTAYPDEKLATIVMANAEDFPRGEFAEKLLELVLPAIDVADGAEPAPRRADPMWEKYVGRYTHLAGESEVAVLNGQLTVVDPSSGESYPLIPQDEHSFVMDDGEYWGELLRFELGANGRVSRVEYGPADYWYPAPRA